MNTTWRFGPALALVGAGAFAYVYTAERNATAIEQAPPAAQTPAVVQAANAFLNSLDPAQREKVQFPFTPQKTATAAQFARNAGVGGGQRGGGRGGNGEPPW